MQKFATTQESSAHLKERGLPISAARLRDLRTTGGGPRFRKFGRFVRYEIEELNAWAEARLSEPRRSTTESQRVVMGDGQAADYTDQ
jgi:hypothetical protein